MPTIPKIPGLDFDTDPHMPVGESFPYPVPAQPEERQLGNTPGDQMERKRREAVMHDILTKQQFQQAQTEHTQQSNATALSGDVNAWAMNPTYKGKSWAQASAEHPEVAQHFGFDVYGNVAQHAPAAWNAAQAGQTGDPTLGEGIPAGMKIKSVTTGADGKVHRTFTPAASEELSDAEQAYAEKMLKGDMPPPTSRGGFNSDSRGRILGYVSQNPDYDATRYQAKQKALNNFTSGPAMVNRTAINTSIGHLGRLAKVVGELGNTDTLPGIVNPTVNTIGNITSAEQQAKIAHFNAIKSAVATEVGRVFQGGVPPVAQVKEIMDNLNINASPKAQKQAITSYIELLASRARNLDDQFKESVQKQRTSNFAFLSPESQKVLEDLKKNGVDVDSILGVDDNLEPEENPEVKGWSAGQKPPQQPKGEQSQGGQPTQINTKAEYDALPKGAKYIDSKGRTATKQ